MKEEKACGCIILDNNKVLLILERNGNFWGFPKGHVEKDESEIETALRETKEETNLDVIIDENTRVETHYIVKNKIYKRVVLFKAKLKTSNIVSIDPKEVIDYGWFSIDDAIKTLSYDNLKNLLKECLKK